jgi:NTP pyrophosphatase (non-canonical NTP hydrolase)
MKMNINVTEQTTTFPCPVNKLKGQLMDCIGFQWETEFGDCMITLESIKWIMKNVKESMYNEKRCYIYNKAFTRYFDNNDPYDGNTIVGGLSPEKQCCKKKMVEYSAFEKIRIWADERGLYDRGDPKTQTLKLMEEAGEICRAVLKNDEPEVIDGIGDCVVVLTNLAHLVGTDIETCIEAAYNEIKNRKGKMANGTYVKDAN